MSDLTETFEGLVQDEMRLKRFAVGERLIMVVEGPDRGKLCTLKEFRPVSSGLPIIAVVFDQTEDEPEKYAEFTVEEFVLSFRKSEVLDPDWLEGAEEEGNFKRPRG